jgi:hypothetical protein
VSALDDRRRLEALYLPPTDDFVLLEIPDMQFVMIEGRGSHSSEAFAHATRWLFAAIEPIRPIAMERMGNNFVEPPLECLWWADDMNDFIAGNRDKWRWRQMIVTPDWVDKEMFDSAVARASARVGEPPASLRLERLAEGMSVQIMHIGPENEEAMSIARRLYSDFLPEHNLIPNGYYHEIYLSNPRRIAPEKVRTVLRQPVRHIT